MRDWITLVENAAMTVDDEDETPAEREAYERQTGIEKAVKLFCEKEIGWALDRSYAVIYDEAENELSISTDEVEVTLEQLMKVRLFGEPTISAAHPHGTINITIKTPPGFNVLTQRPR